MSYFAESLKTLRQKADLSMQALADKACVSKSMISKIERDEVQPTLDVAARLSKALGKTLSEMLHAPHETSMVYLSADQQGVWQDAQGIKRRNISPVFEGLKIEWLQVEFPPHTTFQKCVPLNAQGTEKHILVIEGKLDITVGDSVLTIKKGDSFYFDASSHHEFSNPYDEKVSYFIVIRHA